MARSLGNVVDDVAGMAVRLGGLTRTQHLHRRAHGQHRVAPGVGVHIAHHHPVVGRAVGHLGVVRQRLVGLLPAELQQRRIGLVPGLGRGQQARRAPCRDAVVHRQVGGLVVVGVHRVEVRLERVGQRDIQPVLPEAGGARLLNAMLVPCAVRGQHEVARAERHLVAIDDGIGAAALHNEPQRRGGVVVGPCPLALLHHLDAGIEPAAGRAHVLALGVAQVDHPPPGVLGADEVDRADHLLAQVGIAPDHRIGLGRRLPRLDVVGDGPERPGFEFCELFVIGGQLGAVLDPGPAQHVVAGICVCHRIVLSSLSRAVSVTPPRSRFQHPARRGSRMFRILFYI